jgi:uncharacterized membrane protein
MKAEELRRELLYGNSKELKVRRNLIALSIIGLIDFGIISLYQTGIIKKLPDLPGKIFDSNQVNAAKDAYLFGIPDGLISGTVYAVTASLAAAGVHRRPGAKSVPTDLMLSGAVLGNTLGAGYYLANMAFSQKKICLYCVTGAIINFISAGLVISLFKSRKY